MGACASKPAGAAAGQRRGTGAGGAPQAQQPATDVAQRLAAVEAELLRLTEAHRQLLGEQQKQPQQPQQPDSKEVQAGRQQDQQEQWQREAASAKPAARAASGAAAATAVTASAAASGAQPQHRHGQPPQPGGSLSAVPVPPAPPSAAPLPESVPMDATRIVMHQIVAPTECDGLGICTGGQVLSWIDVCAGLSAKTLARGPCVTISVDAVHFIRPCRLGQVVIVAAMVNRTFSSSMEVGVRVEAEDMRTGARCHCCSAYLTFVSLRSRAGGGEARPLPRIVPVGAEQRAIYEAAEARRQGRLDRRRSLGADPRKAQEVERARLRPVTHREGCPTLPPPLMLPQAPGSRPNSGGGGGGGGGGGFGGAGGGLRWANGGAAAAAAGAADSKPRVSPAATTAYMTQSIMPQHANTLGITFGGQVMSWMEQCAYISASRLRGAHHLTAGMDSVLLARTTRVGDVLYVTAQVTAIFNSSLEVAVTVFGETPSEGGVFHCADACVTVVVVDAAGGPSSIPFALDPQTPNQLLRYKAALKRRRERLEMRRQLLREAAAKTLLDGCGTRLHAYGSCGLLPALGDAGGARWGLNGGGGGAPVSGDSDGSRGSQCGGGGGGAALRSSSSAPVSPAGSPRAGGGGGGGGGGPGGPAALVTSLSDKSAHEFFDNW
ncbi:acyl-coenzyme A thioesterase [Raphidocelis subcapitata]|uniref:Acyl-coenzyme A thioesterase n=1 Tax=Raphidocelis subcapitata TaxID=307507 RepID=A0A2V0P8S2_9CHLO|nr:acyl-coenzyme A thioesterase [Raphidocelis subcapitata]|eukprot:GBF96246.1 acyl-coenzyme A thioesterase [Raphidocelis subcapitata]